MRLVIVRRPSISLMTKVVLLGHVPRLAVG